MVQMALFYQQHHRHSQAIDHHRPSSTPGRSSPLEMSWLQALAPKLKTTLWKIDEHSPFIDDLP